MTGYADIGDLSWY